MTVVSGLAFPGSRVLAGWWKQIATYRPRSLWIGHLVLHRVEARVNLQRLSPVEPLALFVLKSVAAAQLATTQTVAKQLELDDALARQVLVSLETQKLLIQQPAQPWTLTDLGKAALTQGIYPRMELKRRPFFFVESEQTENPPQFLNLEDHPALGDWPAGRDWKFHPDLLKNCLTQPLDWKLQRGFPWEVTEILDMGTEDGTRLPSSKSWGRVILDQPKHLLTLMITVSAADNREKLLGFAIQQQTWILHYEEPVFEIQGPWKQVLPDLSVEPSVEQWRQAWRDWCQPRGLPSSESETCTLERRNCRLRILASSRLLERLRLARSDALKGDAWLLAGTGRIRSAACMEIA